MSLNYLLHQSKASLHNKQQVHRHRHLNNIIYPTLTLSKRIANELTMRRVPSRSGISTVIKTETNHVSSIISIMRRNVIIAGFFTVILLATKGIAEAHLSLSSLPFLRGGSLAFASAVPAPRKSIPPKPILFGLGHNLQRTMNTIGHKIQSETSKSWTGIHVNVGRVTSALIGKILPSGAQNQAGSRKLDEVLRTFKSVLKGSEVDTAQLLKACRAHLILMKSGGTALRVVAKDMEGNLNKAEALFKTLPKEGGRHLASLLEAERESGIHDGNMLKDASAAMGLLWIRRSLSFQLDLYSSLIPTNGRHPKDAAMDAYYKTLSPYHGWMLNKAFPLSLSQMPDRQVFLAKFGGADVEDLDEEYEREIVRKLKSLVLTWEPIINTWRGEFERLDLEDTRRA